MSPSTYRNANIIIQSILEGIIQADQNKLLVKDGIVKSRLIEYCNLKVAVAEKYFKKLEGANYIMTEEKLRGRKPYTVYKITPLGEDRYRWFLQINKEFR